MDVRDLQREKFLSEIIAERDEMILKLFEENQALKKKLEEKVDPS